MIVLTYTTFNLSVFLSSTLRVEAADVEYGSSAVGYLVGGSGRRIGLQRLGEKESGLMTILAVTIVGRDWKIYYSYILY
jgi:hypothetical protein